MRKLKLYYAIPFAMYCKTFIHFILYTYILRVISYVPYPCLVRPKMTAGCYSVSKFYFGVNVFVEIYTKIGMYEECKNNKELFV